MNPPASPDDFHEKLYRYSSPAEASDAVMWWIHRRRMELEDKAKVVASDWGTEFVKFLAALAVF